MRSPLAKEDVLPLGLPLAAASKVDRKVYVAKLGPESKRRGLGRSGLGLAWPKEESHHTQHMLTTVPMVQCLLSPFLTPGPYRASSSAASRCAALSRASRRTRAASLFLLFLFVCCFWGWELKKWSGQHSSSVRACVPLAAPDVLWSLQSACWCWVAAAARSGKDHTTLGLVQ